jgi:dihydroorotate dehydrogenase electron transfer subunit
VRLDSFAGFRDGGKVFGTDEMAACGELSLSVEGVVTDLVDKALSRERPDLILACGPVPMLRSLKTICARRRRKTKVYASLEERMGCGVGACLVCNCGIKAEGNFSYKRVCADGPVFDLSEVEFR